MANIKFNSLSDTRAKTILSPVMTLQKGGPGARKIRGPLFRVSKQSDKAISKQRSLF